MEDGGPPGIFVTQFISGEKYLDPTYASHHEYQDIV